MRTETTDRDLQQALLDTLRALEDVSRAFDAGELPRRGWRVWLRVRGGHLLRSPAAPCEPWPGGRLIATCRRDASHVPPVADCDCGVHFVTSRVWADRLAAGWQAQLDALPQRDRQELVVGQVDVLGPFLPDPHDRTGQVGSWRGRSAQATEVPGVYRQFGS